MNMKTLSRGGPFVFAALALAICAGAQAADADQKKGVRESQSLTNTGFDLMQAKNDADAKPYFDRALEIEPNLAMAHLDLGVVYLDAGDHAAATEQFNLAIVNDTKENDFPKVHETTDGSSGTVTELANRNLEKIH